MLSDETKILAISLFLRDQTLGFQRTWSLTGPWTHLTLHDKPLFLSEMQEVFHPRSDEAVWSSEAHQWLWASQSSWTTCVFKTDVRILGEVRVSVPWAITGCRAPAVPVLMLSALSNDTWLWREDVGADFRRILYLLVWRLSLFSESTPLFVTFLGH